ncbi:hypothetical protein [Glaesserella parasuis]|uniref:hypothetical protein n=1 Tax=Glaesserella parasuis TaxID=738 RepID=UPI001365A720|nr:hypothetical protein [Glaesserella parasuis]MCT8631657.1 hypothetical protein [Glaesserella parasuis]MCT8635705.1 hypothetical protein [Glaesserella parasuis]MCT8637688.1 hypothetical protein [Glaesserella parasuis]MCT8643738.1 hypothetical protein [Glaesserella parasuis]MCT8645701.1 hypothetical protein [Glaesserella parasuis]
MNQVAQTQVMVNTLSPKVYSNLLALQKVSPSAVMTEGNGLALSQRSKSTHHSKPHLEIR